MSSHRLLHPLVAALARDLEPIDGRLELAAARFERWVDRLEAEVPLADRRRVAAELTILTHRLSAALGAKAEGAAQQLARLVPLVLGPGSERDSR